MSFFHVLPSNVAPNTFPRNHASAYSTPVEHNYYLDGKWEVALMHMTYSGCINTFHHDIMSVQKPFNVKEYLKSNNKPLRLTFSSTKTRRDIVNEFNAIFSGVVKAVLDKEGKHCHWKIEKSNVHIVFSESMKKRFDLWHDVISAWDTNTGNYNHFTDDVDEKTAESFIILVPLNYEHKKITIKLPNEVMKIKDFIKRFNEEFTNVLSIDIQKGNANRLKMVKLHDDNIVTVLSKALKETVNFYRTGMYGKGAVYYLNINTNKGFKSPWEVYLYQLSDFHDAKQKMTIPFTLSPRSFKHENDVILYLNELVNDDSITFSLMKDNKLQMKIDAKATTVTFSDTLRDIFAFDQNSYTGKGTFVASDKLSLSRRIHYLYVYSNVNDYVRIGDTEAPLLAVIPFNPECLSLLQEKTFKMPMYVPVIQNPISQIDIGIYDGAGQLVPFATDSVTSIRLHFRKA